MTEEREETKQHGIMLEVLTSALYHFKELAATYLLFAREAAEEEVKQVGRRTTLAAALLIVLGLGATFLGIGISRIISQAIGLDGIGYVITGGSFVLLSVLILAIILMGNSGSRR